MKEKELKEIEEFFIKKGYKNVVIQWATSGVVPNSLGMPRQITFKIKGTKND